MVEPEWVCLNPKADLWLDVEIFEETYGSVQGMSGRGMDVQRAQAIQLGVQLYQGDLLEGWYQDWCLFERERLQLMHLTMLDKLMSHCEAHHQFESGLLYGTQIMAIDNARESTHRRLMRLHYLAGDRTSALRQYKRCADALEEELGVRPGRRTVELRDQINQDQLRDSSLLSPETTMMSDVTNSPLQDVRDHLEQIDVGLSAIQRRLHQDIQVLAQAVNKQQ